MTGAAYLVNVELGRAAKTRLAIAEWVIEASDRAWIMRLAYEVTDAAATGLLSIFDGLVLSSESMATSLRLVRAAFAPVAGSRPGALPAADWWSGECDVNNYLAATGQASYPLGAEYAGVKACGPRDADGASPVVVHFFPGAWGEIEWQCVELSMRFMYLAYAVAPYQGNGADVVWNYPGTLLTKVANGTVGSTPSPGDVLSYGPTGTLGHTSIVTDSTVDSSGNGTIYILEQNGAADGSE